MVNVLPETVEEPPPLLLLPHAVTSAARATRQIPATNQRARKVFSLLLGLNDPNCDTGCYPCERRRGTPTSAACGRSGPGALEIEVAAVEPVGAEPDRGDVARPLDRVRADYRARVPGRERRGRHGRAVVGPVSRAADRGDHEPHRLVAVERAGRG